MGEPQRLAVDVPLLESGLVSLSWLPVDGALSYDVLRGVTLDPSAGVIIATHVLEGRFLDTTPPHGVDLFYWVRAVGAESAEPWSGPVVAHQDVLLWSWSSQGRLTLPVVLTNGSVVFGVNQRSPLLNPPDLGSVYALNPDGTLAWHLATGGTSLSHPVVTPDDRVLFAAGFNQDSILWSVNSSGNELRETPHVPSTPFLSVGGDGTVFLAGRPPGMSMQARSLDREGVLRWADGIGDATTPPRFSIHPDGWLALGNLTLTVYETDGSRRWTAGAVNQTWAEPVWTAPDRLLAVHSRQQLIAFSADGVGLWTNRLAQGSAAIAGPAVDSQGRSYVTDLHSELHAIDADGNRLWQVPLVEPTPFTPVLDREGRILVAAGAAIAIQNADGSPHRVLFLPELPSEAPVLTPDGLLLVVVPGQIRAYRHSSGLDTAALWPCSRHDVRGTSAARFDSGGGDDLRLGIRIEEGRTILEISGPPSHVEIFLSTDLDIWTVAAEIEITGSPAEWEIPPTSPSPTYFQARSSQP
ncbi:MAG: PQQ-binding-like beta-propeller repeat protein [Verrucomicrobiae bacterium]|nr:PQQ-binding-like beta-propeller repeat protein [Verrucomicrobiae bacterium]